MIIDKDTTVANVDVLHDTEWLVALGPTGVGKTTVMTYYLHWVLDKFQRPDGVLDPWIEAIYSVTPFFEGNIIRGDMYPKEYDTLEQAYSAYRAFGLEETTYPAVELENEHVYWAKNPFEGKDGKMYYRPMLHHLLRPLGVLRNIELIRNCVFFGDELGNLIPARNYQDRRQWIIAKMAKDFRRHNVYFIATDQYSKSFDILLRQNFVNQVKPLPDPTRDSISWEYYHSSNDPNFTDYVMHMNFRVYPEDNLAEYPIVPPSVIHRFFDSKHAVPLQFNEPLDEDKVVEQAHDFAAFLKEENPFRILDRRDQMGELRMDLLDRSLKDWNVKRQRYWSAEELNSILARFVKEDGAEMNAAFAARENERLAKSQAKEAGKEERERQKLRYHFDCRGVNLVRNPASPQELVPLPCTYKNTSEARMKAHTLGKHGNLNYAKVDEYADAAKVDSDLADALSEAQAEPDDEEGKE